MIARLGAWTVWVMRSLLLVLALGLIVATILPSAETTIWWIRYLDFPRLEFTILMLLVALALTALGPGRLGALALFGLAGCVAYNCSLLARFSTLADTQQIAARSCPAGNRLRLLEVNVRMNSRNAADLLTIVRQAKPDIAWFQEVDDWWADQLAPLSAEMPNVIKKPLADYFGVALMSRLRLVDPQVKELSTSADPSVFTGVELPSGQVIRLYAVHPRPPQFGQGTAERAAQLMAAALAARRDNAAHVIAGDMNAVPWEEDIGRTERVGRFLDPRIGRGLYITWNAMSWVLRWPLDQILPGQDSRCCRWKFCRRSAPITGPIWPSCATTRQPAGTSRRRSRARRIWRSRAPPWSEAKRRKRKPLINHQALPCSSEWSTARLD